MMLAQPRDASLSAAWTPVGPVQIASPAYGNVTGRITAIAIDPSDSTGNTVYIGTTGGGVWKSTNAAGLAGSVSFIPLTDTLPVFDLDSGNSSLPSLSIGALSVANGVILAGTGDSNDALDSYYGEGILRSADGGGTWTLIKQSRDVLSGNHTFAGLGFAGFAWSMSTPTTVVAALSDAAEGVLVNAVDTANSVRGLYYSTDAGTTWQMAEIKDGSQVVQMPAQIGANNGGNAATSVVWNPVRRRFYAAVRYHGYYESVDGSVWTRLAAQPGTGLTTSACPARPQLPGSAACPIFRGVLAVEPFTGDTFAFTVDAKNLDQGIWQDVCASNGSACSTGEAAFSSRLDSTPLEEGGGNAAIFQGDYNLSLSAVASGADTLLFAGTVDLFRCSLAAGCSFRNTTNVDDGCSAPASVAPAQHAIVTLASGSAPLLYVGNDGGLWRSTDGVNQQGSPCSAADASHFQNLNSGIGSLAEVVNFAQHPSDADTLLIGVGANGSAATSASSSGQPWPQLSPGEAGFAAIDPVTPSNWYISTGPGVSITYCGKGASCTATDFDELPTIGGAQVAYDASLIDPPWILDPGLASNVIIGTCRVWRGLAASGTNWSSANVLSTHFGGPQNASCSSSNPVVRSLAAGGPVVTAAANAAAANAGSPALYAGLAGVLDGGSGLGGHLFSTGTGGTATSATVWTDLALSPVTNDSSDFGVFNPGGFDISSIAVDPHDPAGDTVYATVMGFGGNGVPAPHVYRSTDAGRHWENISGNLPDAPANSVVVDPNDASTVYAGLDTGVYVTTQVATCAASNCWSIYGLGLPNAPVVQLSAAPALSTGSGNANGELRAATYGRGIWQIPLVTAAAPVSAAIQMTPAALLFESEAMGASSPSQTITVTNSGTALLTIGGVAATGDFSETGNCANTSIATGGNCVVQVTFSPTSTGTRSGTLTVYGNVPGGQATADLSGVGTSPAAITLNPLSLNFGTVTTGTISTSQDITIANTGGTQATLQSPSITGDFHMTANTCGSTLPAGVACTVSVVFAPTATGTRNGTLAVADSAGTQTTSLTGIGASPATDNLSPLSLTFGAQQSGTASAAKTVTLANNGDSTLTLIAAQIASGDFTVVSSCGSALAGHATCTMQVACVPTVAGPLSGSLIVSDQFRTQTVALSGTGIAPPQLAAAPSAIAFPNTLIGQTSGRQAIAVSNSGGGTLTIGAISITSGFTETDNCAGKSLVSPATCAVQVIFSPASSGPSSGTLSIAASAAGSSATQQGTVTLTGTGITPAEIVLSPTSLTFGTVTLGSSSAEQNITVSNVGGQTATLKTIAIMGDFTTNATCGLSLAPATSCTMAIVFTPSASGIRTGSVSVTGSAGTQTATLTGGGASPATDTLSPLSLEFATQQAGAASATQAVTLSNNGDNALTLIAAQITNGPFIVASGCGTVLNGHSICTMQVAFVPAISGAATGTLTVSDQLRTQTVSLSGTGVAPPQLAASPLSLTFPATLTGQSSLSQSVTVSNSGSGEITPGVISITGDFTETDNCAGKSLSGSARCAVRVVFSPTSGGGRSGTLTITGSGGTTMQQVAVSLSGAGANPAAIALTPVALGFGTVTLGASSSAQNIAISNTGGQSASLQSNSISGDFATTVNTCGTSLAPSSGCTVSVVFTPTASGVRSGTFSIVDSVGTHTASLSGTGASVATDGLSPLSLTFPPQQLNTTSAAQQVTLTNAGDNALTLVAASITSGDFSAVSSCGPSLNGHSSCTIAVAATPKILGPGTGVLTVSDQLHTQTVALAVTGVAPPGVSLSPSNGLTFAATGVSLTSLPQTITLSNQGGEPLSLTGIAVEGDFSVPTSTNTCNGSVAAASSCSFQVAFSPTAGGARTGSLAIADNAATSPQTVMLQGIGVDFTLSADGAVGVTVSSGQSATFPLLLSSDTGVPGTVAMACAGAPLNATCLVTPANPALGQTSTISVTVATGVTATARIDPVSGERQPTWLAAMFPIAVSLTFLGLRRRRLTRFREMLGRTPPFARFILALAATFLTGCGSGRTIPPPYTPPGGGGSTVVTPSGTYPITVTATGAGLTKTVVLTLIVQ